MKTKKFLLLTLLTVTAAVIPPGGFGASQENFAVLEEGERYFRRATESTDPEQASELYAQALLRFEWLNHEAGIRNGKLLYDIGNIHYRLGNLGKAILYYRRAEIYMPANAQLRHNLSYLRSQRIDRLGPDYREGLSGAAALLRSTLTPRQILLIFTGSFAAAWAAGSLYVLGKKRWKAATAVFFGSLSVLFLILVITGGLGAMNPPEGVIIAAEVTARRGDGKSYESSFQEPLHEGTEFRLLDERSGWYLIRVGGGKTAWIPASSAELVDTGSPDS